MQAGHDEEEGGAKLAQQLIDEELQRFTNDAKAMEKEWPEALKILSLATRHQQNAKIIRDALSGGLLDEGLVRAAMKLELEYFESKQVLLKVPRSESTCPGQTTHIHPSNGCEQGG